ncbi:nucleoside recognition domain-containing protein [Desmospora profundinema]|uniref:Fe2+ transport system protein B n=1 Tax=Desmospora profundinema TaxID=1571184 RepID=A0ABU1IJ12_9BACL|nr:nucleoside recognition domain-containing protein [Desmospora profundinema]MDR6224154.1 Fe2+ transport system protein B [Desmospora profundinema]
MLNTGGTVVLVGMESAGKSTVFSRLTRCRSGEESGVQGTTVTVRRETVDGEDIVLVDTPGIRFRSDSETTRLALAEAGRADRIVLVVRATHARSELKVLLEEVPLEGRPWALIFTFEDRAPAGLARWMDDCRKRFGVPVVSVDARRMEPNARKSVIRAMTEEEQGEPGGTDGEIPFVEEVNPPATGLDHSIAGRWVALGALLALFALPVYMAYLLANALEPWLDRWLLDPVRTWVTGMPSWFQAVLTGDYGLLTLGPYSFLWAFPVVLFIGSSVAVTEETGWKDRITEALDPWLRRVGLNGRDLVPVLTGFGCNVVAVFQSRTCSACTRSACVSLIAFGSACSYQIGATLSLFGSAGRPWLFLPYVVILVVVGAVHLRVWHPALAKAHALLPGRRTFLQPPTWQGFRWRLQGVIKQFLFQAMPIFLLICLVASVIDQVGWLDRLASLLGPLLSLLGLPESAAAGLLFSVLRKDGMLVFNEQGGAWIQALDVWPLFVLVYLASTLTACLVTLWTIHREMGWRTAVGLVAKQGVTSLVSAGVLAAAGWLIMTVV